MRTLVVYYSLFGNTEKIARTIARVLQTAGPVQIATVVEAQEINLADFELLVVGSPTHMHGLPAEFKPFIEAIERDSLPGIQAVAFDTRNHQAKWLSGSAALKIAHHLKRAGCDIVLPPESFFIMGQEGPLESHESERATDWARQILENAKHPNPVTV